MEYIGNARFKGKYLEDVHDNLFVNLKRVRGALFIDNVDDFNLDTPCIKLFKFGEDFNFDSIFDGDFDNSSS
ncbi:MAG: hypothetical protein ACTSVI_04775 [Promethearchaeota archaeon]